MLHPLGRNGNGKTGGGGKLLLVRRGRNGVWNIMWILFFSFLFVSFLKIIVLLSPTNTMFPPKVAVGARVLPDSLHV